MKFIGLKSRKSTSSKPVGVGGGQEKVTGNDYDQNIL